MSEIITAGISIVAGGGTLWGLVKSGLIKIQIGKNGNGNGIEKRLADIETNHLHTIESKLDKLIEISEKHNEQHLEALFILRELKK